MNKIAQSLLILILFSTNNWARAQLRLHGNLGVQTSIIPEPGLPKKLNNFGSKLGISYMPHPKLNVDATLSYVRFNELNDSQSHLDNDGGYIKKIHMYQPSNSFQVEVSMMLYLLSDLIYVKAGVFSGKTQIPSDSGYKFVRFNNTTQHYHYQYTSGYDRGLLLGSGMKIMEKENFRFDFEILFKAGLIDCTRMDLLSKYQEENYRIKYISVFPSLKISYNLNHNRYN